MHVGCALVGNSEIRVGIGNEQGGGSHWEVTAFGKITFIMPS